MIDGKGQNSGGWAYSAGQMAEMHRRIQNGQGTIPVVDEATTEEASNRTEDKFRKEREETLQQRLAKEITDETIIKRIEGIVDGVLTARKMSIDNLTDRDLRIITEQITALYHKKFPKGAAQEEQGLETLQLITQKKAEFDANSSSTFEFYTEAQAIVRNVIDRHEIDQELKKVEKHKKVTDTILSKEELYSIRQDEKNGANRIIAKMDDFIEGEKLEQYLQTVAEAVTELDDLFGSQTEKQGVWDKTRLRLEEIFSTVVALWNSATVVTLNEFVERSNYKKDDARFMEAKARLEKYITAGEKLAQAHDNTGKQISIRTGFDKETLQKAKDRMLQFGQRE